MKAARFLPNCRRRGAEPLHMRLPTDIVSPKIASVLTITESLIAIISIGMVVEGLTG